MPPGYIIKPRWGEGTGTPERRNYVSPLSFLNSSRSQPLVGNACLDALRPSYNNRPGTFSLVIQSTQSVEEGIPNRRLGTRN